MEARSLASDGSLALVPWASQSNAVPKVPAICPTITG